MLPVLVVYLHGAVPVRRAGLDCSLLLYRTINNTFLHSQEVVHTSTSTVNSLEQNRTVRTASPREILDVK